MAINFQQKLQKLEGAVVGDYNPHDHIIRTPSPSVNFIFGKGHGLPLGHSMCLYGPPKAGKSVLSNAIIGQLHRDYPTAWAVKFDTEYREEGQLSVEDREMWGIDINRYQAYSVNSPMLVFDRIEQELAAYCQEGMDLKLVIIDSITGISGRRAMNQDTIETQQRGDHAATIQEGLKRILPIQHKYKFAVILTAHVRAEQDAREQMRGNQTRMAAAFGVQHYADYYVCIEGNRNKDGREDMLGQKYVDDGLTDMKDNSDQLGHRIFVKMKDSSLGPKGRTGEFTLNYQQGIVNQHEEVFTLGKNRKVIQRPNNRSYVIGENKFNSEAECITALRDDPALAQSVIAEVFRRDRAGAYAAADVVAETVE